MKKIRFAGLRRLRDRTAYSRAGTDGTPAGGSQRRRPRTDFATVAFAASSSCVNVCAFIGQYGFASSHFGMGRPADTLYAVTIESIATTVSAYADRAQRNNDSAFRIKLGSYLIGAGVGLLNYWHFAGAHFAPTPKALAFGFLSAASPWLWSLFSRRQSRDILLAEGLIEGRSVRLGATRWFYHPALSFKVARFASLFGIRDPREAMLRYAEYRNRAGKPLSSFEALLAELEPGSGNGPEPAVTENRNRAGEPEPGRPRGRDAAAVPEPEPVAGDRGDGTEPELEDGSGTALAVVRDLARPGGRPVRDMSGLREIARPIVAEYWAANGRTKHITAEALRARLGVSKTTACRVLNDLRSQVEQDLADGPEIGPVTGTDPAAAGAAD